MLEAMAQARPLAGGRLQVDRDAQPLGPAVHLVEPLRDPHQPGFLALRPCGRRDAPPGRRSPAAAQRSTSTAIASIDFCHRGVVGLPRLIRYEVWATGSTIPVSRGPSGTPRRARRSSGGAFHWLLFLVKSWTVSKPTACAARTARSQPPAIDM